LPAILAEVVAHDDRIEPGLERLADQVGERQPGGDRAVAPAVDLRRALEHELALALGDLVDLPAAEIAEEAVADPPGEVALDDAHDAHPRLGDVDALQRQNLAPVRGQDV